MKRNAKKFLSMLLSVSMAFGVWTMPVYATQTGNTDDTVAAVSETEQNGQNVEAPQENTAEVQQDDTTAPQETEEAQLQETAAESQQDTEETAVQDTEAAPQQETEETAKPQQKKQKKSAKEKAANKDTEISVSANGTDVTIDVSKIDVPHINVNEPLMTTYAEIDESDPQIQTFRAELKEAEVTDEDTGDKVDLTQEQIDNAVGMFQQYLDYRKKHADVLGVQNPFYLQFNDNKDKLGMLGEMLTLAGVSVDKVRNGEYSYDDLLGMILNFQYGDSFGVEYYGDTVEAKRDEALKTVEESGAQTDEQKLLVLNTWLAQNNTFDMSYIMNQMDPDNPVMVAKDPQ